MATDNNNNTFQLYPSSLKTAANAKKGKTYTEAECLALLKKCDQISKAGGRDMAEAEELCRRAGLPYETDLSRMLRQRSSDTNTASALTAGHSNTNHVVTWTGDFAVDQTAHLKRNLLERARFQQPETKSEDRWDKPRVPGERRRRIVREKDRPGAPPEPPPSGYVVYLGQRTTKWRHDHANERHHQARVVQEISKIWRVALTDREREYYNTFVDEARAEYKRQHMEYRATGLYTPSDTFERIEGAGLWLRKRMEEKNELEREIASYETVVFPARPPEYDEEYRKREEASRLKRKEKLKREVQEKRRKKGDVIKDVHQKKK